MLQDTRDFFDKTVAHFAIDISVSLHGLHGHVCDEL